MSEETVYIEEFSKQTSERRSVTVTWENRIPTGVTISSCAVAAFILPAQTADNSVISNTTATVTSYTASVYAVGGTNGTRYRISFTATLSDTQILKEDVLMIVENVR